MPSTKSAGSATWASTLRPRTTSAGAALGQQARREPGVEELGQRRHAAFARGLGHVDGGVDAEDVDPGALEILEQVAVVAGELDDAAGAVQPALDHQRVDQRLGVVEHRRRAGREVEVVREQALGRHGLGDLDQRAGRAQDEVERKTLVGLGRGVGLDQGVGERQGPEAHDRRELGGAARAARFDPHPRPDSSHVVRRPRAETRSSAYAARHGASSAFVRAGRAARRSTRAWRAAAPTPG